ncbi:MAG TPA: hypothetical protein VLJ13_10935 [Brevundimonas sp.]|nr:hypothetical protein [Brevundimonas sp.]
MKRTIAAAAMTAILAVAGCGRDPAPEAPAAGGAAAQTGAVAASTTVVPATDRAIYPEPPPIDPKPAAPGAPSFAVIYPGGTATGPATVANGPGGPGGIVRYKTANSPDVIIDYYRRIAERDGLTSVMAMNQGDARAYGAAAEDGSGKLLRVVATATADGGADVQLDWTAGK